MPALTELDRRLVSALRADGRAPVAQLAERLGVSRATVSKRLDSLIARGVIVGFTARVRDDGADHVRAVSLIEVERRTTDHVISHLRGFPEIQALHTTNGNWDLIAEIVCANLPDLDDVLRRMRSIEGIVTSQTNLLLSSITR